MRLVARNRLESRVASTLSLTGATGDELGNPRTTLDFPREDKILITKGRIDLLGLQLGLDEPVEQVFKLEFGISVKLRLELKENFINLTQRGYGGVDWKGLTMHHDGKIE